MTIPTPSGINFVVGLQLSGATQGGYLLPGPQFLPPLLQLQAVLLVQLLQLLGLVFDQQVTLLILEYRGECFMYTLL